jgi:exoribonuclease R
MSAAGGAGAGASATATATATASATVSGVLYTKDYCHFELHDEITGAVLGAFEGAKIAVPCLPGDAVSWDPASGDLKQLAPGPYPLLAGYLETNSKTTYGLNPRGQPLFLFVPLNPSYPSFLVASKDSPELRSCKQIALVRFLRWDKGSVFPRAGLERFLGKAGDLPAEEEALLWSACPWAPLTKGFAASADDAETAGHRVRLSGYTFNIDPVGCKDIDDVLTLELKGDGKWVVTITISDVASAVEELTAVDIMAATTGQTLYRDGVAVRPMLPPALSEEACSLIAGTERRGVSLQFVFDASTRTVEGWKWLETIVRNDETFTYESFIAGAEKRTERDMVKSVVEALEGGREVVDPHEWIEVLMKTYNTRAAALLHEAKAGVLRRHSAPDQAKLERFVALDPALGFLASHAAEYCLAEEEVVGHFGFGGAAYCHATSPIRRYADLVNQRILKQLIRGNDKSLFVSVSMWDLNQRAKASKAYERDLCYVRAILGGGEGETERVWRGKIVEAALEEPESGARRVRFRIWMPEWRRLARASYICTIANEEAGRFIIVSADGAETFEFAVGQEVTVRAALLMGQRRWKDRLLLQVRPH